MKLRNYGGSNEQIFATAYRSSQPRHQAPISHDLGSDPLCGLSGHGLCCRAVRLVDTDLRLCSDTRNVVMVQATLFEALQAPRNQREARFLAFHQANPIVYKLWDKFTREALARGHKRVGAALIMERIRWETSIELVDARPDGGTLKINDHHKAYYARLWMKDNPAHRGLFETRTVEGDNE